MIKWAFQNLILAAVLVEVPLGAAGRHTVRLETDDVGLAVYGPEMGRYPFGPEVR